ncbi:disulfide bond formation protein B [Pseudomonas nicosulfuronedens]
MNSPIFQSENRLPLWLNVLALYAICAVLLVAFYYQLWKFELPCPLCLLQRVGMLLIGFGFLFNVRFGVRNRHYAMTLLGALVAGSVGMRQVFLHITPGDAGYGSPFLGLHFYTWTVVASLLVIVAVALMMALKEGGSRETPHFSFLGKLAALLFIVLIAANLVSTVLECGGGQCDDNPTFYQLLR